jgi:hypothetical protein
MQNGGAPLFTRLNSHDNGIHISAMLLTDANHARAR